MHYYIVPSGVTFPPMNSSLCAGLQVSPIQMPLIVGDIVSINCSTDLDVTTIEWIKGSTTVTSCSSQSLTLLLDPVSADHHNTRYTCRANNSYGNCIQEKIIDVTVQSKSMHASLILVRSYDYQQTDFRVYI